MGRACNTNGRDEFIYPWTQDVWGSEGIDPLCLPKSEWLDSLPDSFPSGKNAPVYLAQSRSLTLYRRRISYPRWKSNTDSSASQLVG
jgi:hypothetical protein